jgi:tetratricopeptide (TPR) repeat protein
MKLRKYLVLAGALSILFSSNPVVKAGWLDDLADKFDDWMEDFKRKRDIRYTYPQLCKKHFEGGDLNLAYTYCTIAQDYDKDFIYQAAVVQYIHEVEKETDAERKSKNVKNAIDLLQGAEKYLLKKLEDGKGNEQSKIETKKKLANVYLLLSCAYAEYYREIEDDDAANWGRDALETARKYFDKAIALTDEAEGYIIVIAGIKLSSIYLENASYAYKWLLEAEAVLGKTLEVSEKMKPTALFPKKEIENAKMRVYNLRGWLASRRIEYKKDVDQEFERGKEFYLKAIEIAKKIDRIQDLPILMHNLALLYKVKGEYDEYEKLTKEAIKRARKIARLGGPGGRQNRENMRKWAKELADFYSERGEKERAKEFLEEMNRMEMFGR